MARSKKYEAEKFENTVTSVDHAIAATADNATWYKNENFKFWTDLPLFHTFFPLFTMLRMLPCT